MNKLLNGHSAVTALADNWFSVESTDGDGGCLYANADEPKGAIVLGETCEASPPGNSVVSVKGKLYRNDEFMKLLNSTSYTLQKEPVELSPLCWPATYLHSLLLVFGLYSRQNGCK
eukprot:gb/GECG01013089.1/.p1 GENE.gb/GECG01013089.1/~~gb/GECG01013089.1/.p1  ORF type:complete len:116 (+),score=10.36 gb/GECG01013089.1/:1-348(+)